MGEAVAEVAKIADRLRAPGGCPWDREQTHASLRPFLLEEAYEALEALDTGNVPRLREELGDLLFQVVIHAQLAREEDGFDLGDVAQRLAEKLVRRHPHVFEGKAIDHPHVFEGKAIDGDVLSQWERIKREEQPAQERGLLDGIPAALPALFRSERLQERVERIGVEGPAIDMPIDIDDERSLGDLLFDVVAAARGLGYDAETALRAANERFVEHVRRMEETSRSAGRELTSYSSEEVRALWEATA
ncbi:MAG: MazG family protein [Chloroflexi bacterium]|nr:MazG family protein [Chloroflexota bacterium]